MASTSNTIDEQIRHLLATQKFAALATQEHKHPYINLVAFAETNDLKDIIFATTRSTRKFGNINQKAGVALLVDNRSNEVSDIRDSIALTIVGNAAEIPKQQENDFLSIYINKHPHMEEFVCSPTTALMKLNVDFFVLVTRFQNVTILKFK